MSYSLAWHWFRAIARIEFFAIVSVQSTGSATRNQWTNRNVIPLIEKVSGVPAKRILMVLVRETVMLALAESKTMWPFCTAETLICGGPCKINSCAAASYE
jgi:hypothetical protein